MTADVSFDVTDVALMSDARGKVFVIRSEIIGPRPHGQRRTGKFLHLRMTAKQAMRLMTLLRVAQTKLHLPAPADVEGTGAPHPKNLN
jgi:hypothetical protein